MSEKAPVDLEMAHRFFSADCFNRSWELMDKPSRTPEEEQSMLQLGLASLWHWTLRPDCTPGNLSVGYWQVSRIFALLGQAESARSYGLLCLEASRGEGTLPFHRGYAYEALARAEALDGKTTTKEEYLQMARSVVETLPDQETRQMLLADLGTIQ